MRWSLLWQPGIALERVAYLLRQRRRLRRLRGTVAEGLEVGHIESLELLELCRGFDLRCVYDIGACTGTWSRLAKALYPEAVVQAFEPLASHCAGFERSLAGVAGVRLHRTALGAATGTATLHVMRQSDSSSLLPATPAGRAEWNLEEVTGVQVDVHRLDDYRRAFGLGVPDLLKLDVQGFELEVLRGARETLLGTRAIIAELSFFDYYDRQCRFHEVVGHLAEAGFHLAALGEHTPTGRRLGQADVLFLREGAPARARSS